MRHSVIDIKFQPWFGLQITDTVYNDKVKHSPLANTSEILTTCFNTVSKLMLSMPRAIWPVAVKHDVIHKTKVHNVF